ncbi:MAG TPA: hypothetical protein VG273_21785 [Bryobacteraceae bacterium]|nr:hypothetical protein [Bryobacteraceae bacterium]
MKLATKAVILLCGTAAFLSADTLILKSGERVEGTYMGGTSRQVRMDLNGNVRTFEIGDIRSVTFADQSYQAPAPPPPPVARTYDDPRRDRDREERPPSMGVMIPADTPLTIRMIDSVDSDRARLGQTFRASLDEPVFVNGNQVIPRGADVLTKLVAEQQSGKIEGRAALTLAISTVTINGQPVDVTTTDVRSESGSRGKRSAGVIGGTAALGAIIGGIAGGGKGAAIGAGSGAAVGTGAEVLTSGQKVRIPSETRLTFRLQNPIQL